MSRFASSAAFLTAKLFLMAVAGVAPAADYHIDPDGDDTHSGLQPAEAWKSLEKVNATTFQPGDKVLFKAGKSWIGELCPKGSGRNGAPIELASYGEGAMPLIEGTGAPGSAAVRLVNQEYWTIRGFELTNRAMTRDRRFGILVSANDGQVKHGIHIMNNRVHDVFATPVRKGPPSFYQTGGIRVQIDEPGRADDVLIEGNEVRNVVAIGICFWGEGEHGGMDWNNLSTNVVLRRNLVSHTAADGILVFGTDNELAEYNHVEHAGALGVAGGPDDGTAYIAGMWPTRHRGGLWQFNEADHTKRWTGDGEGFDNDVYLQGTTVYQFNRSHDNDGGFFLDCGSHDTGHSLVRYNVSSGESGGRLDRGTAVFYNNILHRPGGRIDLSTDMAGAPGNSFSNNIFVCAEMRDFDRQSLSHNVYHGGAARPANDAFAIMGDPMLVNPGSGGGIDGFRLGKGSPCLGSGVLIPENGGRDPWGNPVSATDPPNRGVDNAGFPKHRE